MTTSTITALRPEAPELSVKPFRKHFQHQRAARRARARMPNADSSGGVGAGLPRPASVDLMMSRPVADIGFLAVSLL